MGATKKPKELTEVWTEKQQAKNELQSDVAPHVRLNARRLMRFPISG